MICPYFTAVGERIAGKEILVEELQVKLVTNVLDEGHDLADMAHDDVLRGTAQHRLVRLSREEAENCGGIVHVLGERFRLLEYVAHM